MPVLNSVAALQAEMTAWRRDFHRHPELSYEVHRTARVVAEKLRAFGCDEVAEGIGRTGVVGLIRGSAPGRTIGLRSDMDALPIPEATGLDWASATPGLMHACGHDGHMAMLLGAAKHLAETRRFAGAVAVIFQPAEEDGGGGEAMVKDGMMERFAINEVYGMHNMPDLPVGAFAIRPGPLMASTDEFDIVIEGRGGHAAKPHKCVDPVLAACRFVRAAQSVVSRNMDPVDPIVVTICGMWNEGSTTYNVIPPSVRMTGTVRCYSEANRALARARLDALAEGIAAADGARARNTWVRGYPPTINDARSTEFAAEVAADVAGGCDRNTPMALGAEDFAYMLEARPGAMIYVGNGPSAECHHPKYDFADETMPAGASYWVRLAERALPLDGKD